MDKLLEWVKDHAAKVLALPAAIGGLEFVVNLLGAAQDGVITKEELHNLVSMASPVQILAIAIVMFAMKKGK